MFDRKIFFDRVHNRPFGGSLSQKQVEGLTAILDEAERRGTPRNKLAYILATPFHETGQEMQPIVERGDRSYFNKYNAGTRIGKMLGNTQPGDGFNLRGRGLVQITGRANYAKASKKIGVDFLARPDLTLEMKYAVLILFAGMEGGWFTGKSLDSYIDDKDESDAEDLREFIKSRFIINGTDKAAKIGGYAIDFEHALAAAGYPNVPVAKVPLQPTTQNPKVPPATSVVAAVGVGGVALSGAVASQATGSGWWVFVVCLGFAVVAAGLAFIWIRARS